MDGNPEAEKVGVCPGVVKVVVVEVNGMVLSNSDKLMLDMLVSVLDIDEDRSIRSWPEVDSEGNAAELVIVSWVRLVEVEVSVLVEESVIIVDGDPEVEKVVDSSEVELDCSWEVENVVENEKVVLVMSMHKQSVQKSVTTSSRQQSPPS